MIFLRSCDKMEVGNVIEIVNDSLQVHIQGDYLNIFGLFSVALKQFGLFTYKLVIFPKYEFYTFNQSFGSIDY